MIDTPSSINNERTDALNLKDLSIEQVLKNSSDGIVLSNERNTILWVNPAFTRIFGYLPEEVVGKDIDDLITNEDVRDEAIQISETVLSGKGVKFEGLRYRKDGTPIHVQVIVDIVTRKENRLIVYANYRDITDRVRMENALRESESRIRAVFEASPEPIVVYDTDGYPILMNRAFTRLFGWNIEEVKGKHIPFVPDEEKEKTKDKIEELKRYGKPVRMMTKRLTRDGRVLDIFLSAAAIKDENGSIMGSVVTLSDITERNRLEAQFYAAQRMESLGTLAGGIAHDFNNLLMGIQGNVSLLLLDTDTFDPKYERLKNIEEHVKRGADLTRQLLGFARGGMYEPKPLKINDIIKANGTIFERTRKDIRIHMNLEKGLWMVKADRSQMDQVFMNVLINAGHAMPDGGDIFIETNNAVISQVHRFPYTINPGNYVKISITDTGVGMDEQTRQRVFEPFFTTKGLGRGTGLGLASVYGIIKNHGGIINVYSEKGKGSTFTIYLPALDPDQSKLSAEGEKEDKSKTKGVILIVDDEDMVLDVSKKMLEMIGYEVITAKSGREAVERYKQMKGRVNLVILDMIMPGMGGMETFRGLKELKSDVKVLLSSGYSYNEQAEKIMNMGCSGFIQKPFTLQELSSRIDEILASS